jgi:hypothetical protein
VGTESADSDYSQLTVVEALPNGPHYPEKAQALLRSPVNATIVRIGSPEEEGIEGGGLVLDYRRSGDDVVRRVVLAFTELGMWIEWEGPIRA